MPWLACRCDLFLDDGDWCFDTFMRDHLAEYLDMTREFMDECLGDVEGGGE